MPIQLPMSLGIYLLILRSLTKHVKEQNWFAVWIDFAIVVVGVFIGIQVANWNDTQAEIAQTQRMLGSVLSDLQELRGQVGRSSLRTQNTAKSLDELMSALEVGERLDPDVLNATFRQAVTLELLPDLPSGLDEILVAARLDLLERTALRDALRDLAAEFATHTDFRVESTRQFNAALDVLYNYARIKRTWSSDTAQSPYKLDGVDVDRLWASDEARIALTRMYVFHSNFYRSLFYLNRSIDRVLAEAGVTANETIEA
ncbi:MAG: hypothetical protein Cons2KO_01850 [Congregibacter sp.]